jgi:hypothetical protein
MMEDSEYVLNQILSNMKEVIIELFAWILVRTYGPIDQLNAQKILTLKGLGSLYANPDFKSLVKELSEAEPTDKLNNSLYVGIEFIIEAVRRWKSVYGREYLASQRRIRFLHSAKTIEQFKEYLQQTNEETKTFGYSWKRPDTTALASLPKLSGKES